MAIKKKVKKKQTEKKSVAKGTAYIHSTFNNTIVTIADAEGNVLCWSSAGACGFRGSRKGTPFAAQRAAEKAAMRALDFGMKSIDVRISGPGGGRETSLRTLASRGLGILSIADVTPIAHNGCRPPKRPRN